MPLTRDFKLTVQARTRRDPAFRRALLREAAELLLGGDVDTGKSVLRDYINATVGFPALARMTQTPAKSLMRMFGPEGNPRADHIFGVVAALQQSEGVHLEVHASGHRRISGSRSPVRQRSAVAAVHHGRSRSSATRRRTGTGRMG